MTPMPDDQKPAERTTLATPRRLTAAERRLLDFILEHPSSWPDDDREPI